MSSRGRSSGFRFGVFELDTVTGELRKHGIRIKLQEQPRQILLALLEKPGEVVTREQIQKQIWPGDTFVDFDNAINSAVRKLREALGDKAENPRFVETLARRGYRFIAPVSVLDGTEATLPTMPVEPAAPMPVASAIPETPAALPPIPKRSNRGRVALLATLVACGAAAFIWQGTRNIAAKDGEPRLRPLTGNAGIELHPTLAPDGTRVAYSWGLRDRDHFSIFVKLIGPGDPVRLTEGARDFSPAWSPDGRWIALLRDLGNEAALLLVPASGGHPRELARVVRTPVGSMSWVFVPSEYASSLAWSRDGKYVFTSGQTVANAPAGIVRVSVDTGDKQRATSPAEVDFAAGDSGPAVSPDGRALAFVRSQSMRRGDLYVGQLSDATPFLTDIKRITADASDVRAPTWSNDGKELIFSSDRAGARELWRVSATPSATPERVVGLGENAYELAVSPAARNLVYGRAAITGSLWKLPLDGSKAREPVQITAASARISKPQYSPDRSRIAFESGRSGASEVWVCQADGSDMVQLTKFGKSVSGSPRWSPDGKYIAFDSNVGGFWDIYLVSSDGGTPVRITKDKSNIVPSWSYDGTWIYYTSNRAGHHQVWKIRPDGTSATQVTTTGGALAVESPDGKYLYYKASFKETDDLLRVALKDGTQLSPKKILSGVRGRLVNITEHGIYFTAGNPDVELRYFDLSQKTVRVLATGVLGNYPYADVSADGSAALFGRMERWGTNLMLVENFR